MHADANQSETNSSAKRTCVTSDLDDVAAMDVEHTNDNYIDAEEELESVYRFSLFKRNNLI